ncbi:acyl-CoA dehydrogenase family protein [Parageobacillus thermoglucosidasius]|uniref:Acyl-CoA dehydrogenase domain-containing protein n=1 Tax=Geobacillus sp. (strain Y4.1MC1) TaxID=581103 RepID=A0A7U3YEP1_GEOS0|nr:acyl-CoA dehydrogenase family protein [Parageobacillus thermoglucosidasius]KYD16052.1 Acyl-CoA dehydrogenase [Anoxybacillus flavithermus]REK58170.1 MAG: isovaleryl-CoA dehydrogenase [Geobacillus sp.]AEH47622.1 Isovaleryl-CoA dehydrogenase [Parageobacillus thermoglucosidasius C56-YS93]EID44676.1 acyl-CoA dehydrogenase [Parageobacillus thermoglucosidasius TNO-09.020]MBY6269599.1 isovaleryl-CoA dehydrogenase [Parageobacillus thermoglucosidasius]
MRRLSDVDPNLLANLKKYLDKELYAYAEKELEQFYQLCMTDIDRRAVHTDREGQPRLIKYDRFGNEISEVWVNEGYQQTAKQTYETGIVGYVHKPIPELGRKGNYIYSYAQGYLLSQVETGVYCPVTLTMATAYLLEHFADENLKKKYLPHVISTGEIELYEGATFLTERQGGSDVGANAVRAVPCGDHYKLFGEKYFASNAGRCGVAAVLARIDGSEPGTKGLSLFLVPWRNEDGTLNSIQIRRLKDKLGVRAVPSAEVVFDGAKAYVIGDPKKGFYYMMEALNLSRVCNAVGSIGIMKRALEEAKQYAANRTAFGHKLTDYPMVRETLADLTARQEVQTSACFEMISVFERVMTAPDEATEEEKAWNRLLIALLKMRTAEEAIAFAHEAIEMHGGNGYIEDFVTPRLLRDAQVLTVWEGTANILGLEVLRLMRKYRVHEQFIAKMAEALSSLSDDVEPLASPVKQGLHELAEALKRLDGQPEEVQTFHAKKIANRLCDIYLSVVALERAQENERNCLIAQLFLQHIWNRHLVDEQMLSVRHFEVIIHGQRQLSPS